MKEIHPLLFYIGVAVVLLALAAAYGTVSGQWEWNRPSSFARP